MKSTFFGLVLFLVAFPLHAAPAASVSDANYAYNYDLHDEAVRLFTELLARQPAPAAADAADFHFKRAYALFKLKRYDQANTDLLDALELGLETPEIYNLLALVYSGKGEPDMGVEYGRKAVDLARKAISPHRRRSRTDFNTYAENLIVASREIAERDPAFVKGQQALASGRDADAETAFTAALTAYPTGPHVLACHLHRGLARLELRQHDPALEDFQRVIELGGESAAVLNHLGRAFLGLNNHIAAYDHFFRAYDLITEKADKDACRKNLTAASRTLSAQADALHFQAQAALRNGDSATAHTLYARAMLLPGGRSTDFLAGLVALSDKAINAFDAQIAPLDKISRTGTPESIRAEFQRLKQIYPLNTRLDFLRDDAFFTLLRTKYTKSYALLGKAQNVPWGEWKKAIKYLNEAIKLAPEIPVLYLDRATYLSNLKDPKALQDIDTAVRLLGGETHRTHSCRGEFYRNTGNTTRAFEHLQAALKIDNAKNSWETWTRKFFDDQEKNQPPPANTDTPTDHRSPRQRAFDLAQTSPGSEASGLYAGLGYTDHNLNEGLLTNFPEVNRKASDFSWAIVLDPLNGAAYCGRAYCYDKVNDLNAALADFTRAKNVGDSRGGEGISMIWQKKANASIDAYLKNGGNNNNTASSSQASGSQSSGTRYCMRCNATGSIYAYEDGTDAYNHRVRVEKKKSCPECNGRGVR